MYVPENVVTNEDLSKIMDTSNEWIIERTGIKERRHIKKGDGNTTAIMGVKAAEIAMKRASIEKNEIDLFTNKIAPSNAKAALKISKGKTKDIKEAIEKVQEIDKVNIEKQKEVFASKDLNTEFNKFLESSTGIGAEKVFSESKGTVRGRKVKKSFGDYIIPVGAEDFAGLLHKTLAKGKQGEKQLEFYKKNLYDPYNLANENITRERTALMNDFRALKQNLTSVPKNLNKMTKGGDFTVEQALRVAVWEKQGMEIPGLSKTDKIELLKEAKEIGFEGNMNLVLLLD